jgi:hypothetical protein
MKKPRINRGFYYVKEIKTYFFFLAAFFFAAFFLGAAFFLAAFFFVAIFENLMFSKKWVIGSKNNNYFILPKLFFNKMVW